MYWLVSLPHGGQPDRAWNQLQELTTYTNDYRQAGQLSPFQQAARPCPCCDVNVCCSNTRCLNAFAPAFARQLLSAAAAAASLAPLLKHALPSGCCHCLAAATTSSLRCRRASGWAPWTRCWGSAMTWPRRGGGAGEHGGGGAGQWLAG